MTTKKFDWQKTLQSFEAIEKNLLENYNEVDFVKFRKDFHDTFTIENGVEEWQIREAQERFRKFLNIMEELKKNLLIKRDVLTDNNKNFTKYAKASILK